MKKKPLIILTGPTSVGKTSLSILLAKAVNGEIISADSMQVYKQMDIGTAKIKKDEMCDVTHYLIDILEPDEEFNVVKFKEYTLRCMEQIYQKGKIPILVGGTGFYIQAVLYDINFTDQESDSTYREELEQLALDKGSDYLHNLLINVDPESADAIHPNNTKRVIRALEYHKQTGGKISSHNEEQRGNVSPYQFCYFVLNNERATLYQSIDRRVDLMLTNGLLEEVKSLANKGYQRDLVSMQGLGYKELLAYFEGEYSYEEAIDLLKRDTRHFAKRQITWFKREKEVIWINKNEFENDADILTAMLDILKANEVT